MQNELPEFATHGFIGTDTFPIVPRQVRVLVYFEPGINMYLVDIQTFTLQSTWRGEPDPFRSISEDECLAYYEELKTDTYTNVEVLRGN